MFAWLHWFEKSTSVRDSPLLNFGCVGITTATTTTEKHSKLLDREHFEVTEAAKATLLSGMFCMSSGLWAMLQVIAAAYDSQTDSHPKGFFDNFGRWCSCSPNKTIFLYSTSWKFPIFACTPPIIIESTAAKAMCEQKETRCTWVPWPILMRPCKPPCISIL